MIPTRAQIESAAKVFAEHGIEFNCPWDGTLDDLEQERFDALRLAIAAAAAEEQGHMLQGDLAELCRMVGHFDGAQPKAPHDVFQECLTMLKTKIG